MKEKLFGHFKQQTNEISHEKIRTWLRKRKLREKNWISSDSNRKQRHKNYVKTIKDKTKQNS